MVDISKDVILAQIKREIANRTKKIKNKAIQIEESRLMGVRDTINREKSKNIKVARAEEMLIGIAFLHQDKINSIVNLIPPEKFITEFGRRLMSALYNNFQQYGEVTLSQFNSNFTVDEMGYISRIFSFENLDNPSIIIEDCIKIINFNNMKNDVSTIDNIADNEFTDMIKKLKK
jgi:DNA primase